MKEHDDAARPFGGRRRRFEISQASYGRHVPIVNVPPLPRRVREAGPSSDPALFFAFSFVGSLLRGPGDVDVEGILLVDVGCEITVTSEC
jgi:hypothetical protein